MTALRGTTCTALENPRGAAHTARGGVHHGGGHTSVPGISFLGETRSSAERHELTWLSGRLKQSPPAALPNLNYCDFPGLGPVGACVVLLGSGHQPEGPARVQVRGKLQMAGTKPCPIAWSPDGTRKRKSKKPPRRAQHQMMLKCSGLHGGPPTGTG